MLNGENHKHAPDNHCEVQPLPELKEESAEQVPDWPGQCIASSNKCHATSNRCLTSSNKKLLEASATLLGLLCFCAPS